MNQQTQAAYLIQVKNTLLLHANRKDLHTTLEDLNLFFLAGLESGKTEEQLCNELGSPSEFTENILLDIAQRKKQKLSVKLDITLILFFILGVSFSLFTFYLLGLYNPFSLCVPALFIPYWIWYSLGGNSLYSIPQTTFRGSFIRKLTLPVTLIFVITEQACLIMFYREPSISSLATLSAFVAFFFIVILLATSIVTVSYIYRGNVHYFSNLLLCFGAIFSSTMYISYLQNMDAHSTTILFCVLPYIINTVASLIHNTLYSNKK